MIHFDTNFLIFTLIPGSAEDRRVLALRAAGESFNISAMAWAEFRCGPVTAEDVATAARMLPQTEPVTAEDAERGAELVNAGGRRRGSLADCLIAACCVRVGAELATNNLDDFRLFEPFGLRIITP